MALLTARPGPLLRWALQIPLLMYRVHLDWLFGHHLARVTHVGRRSGRIRQTVVEVLRYDARTREIVVAAGWGGRTAWYRNLMANTALEVRCGRTAYRPTQRLLSADETYAEVVWYIRRYPWLARFALPMLLGLSTSAPSQQQRAIVGAGLRGVSFTPRGQPAARSAPASRDQARSLSVVQDDDRPLRSDQS
jgi:deazaflavin-dependent oxidoreductase (nitroreductase family)